MALAYIAFTAQKRPKTRPRTAAWTAATARNGNRWKRDNTAAASRQPCDMYGQLRRVVHLLEGAPAMIVCNLRTPAGLVNDATGTVVGVVLRGDAEDKDIKGAVSAADVAYVVMDVPKYCV